MPTNLKEDIRFIRPGRQLIKGLQNKTLQSNHYPLAAELGQFVDYLLDSLVELTMNVDALVIDFHYPAFITYAFS